MHVRPSLLQQITCERPYEQYLPKIHREGKNLLNFIILSAIFTGF